MTEHSTAYGRRIRVGIFFGGKSAEHDVSLLSARNVFEALDIRRFEPVLIKIDRSGVWREVSARSFALAGTDSPDLVGDPISPVSPAVHLFKDAPDIDVAFPVLHGPFGEDGSIQGLFEVAGIPYVGPRVLSSAINMDKDVSKRLLRVAGIEVAPYLVLRAHEEHVSFDQAVHTLGLPLFIKPANMGSSIGVSKVAAQQDFSKSLDAAFQYDEKVLVEGAVVGDEVECAVLGNETPKASVLGRIIPRTADFYDYMAKYIDEHGAILEIPAKLPPAIATLAQATAVTAYQALECTGMSRVDMFVTPSGQVIVNEINTIPGFTDISMYPKLWEASGIPYTELITQLIDLAIERHKTRGRLKILPG